MKKMLLISFILLSSVASQASQYLFAPSVTYFERDLTDNNNPTQSSKISMIDMKFGYVFDFGLYVGGLYSLIDDNLTSDSSDFHFGPSVGYYNSGFLASLTYYLFGERDLAVGNTKYAKVSGYQLDIAYAVPVIANFSVGPQLTYQDVEYKDAQVGGLSSDTNYKWSGVTPYIALFFHF